MDEAKSKATVTALPRAHQPDLLTAMRRARLEDAERTLVTSELRVAEIARLEQLRVALSPLFEQAGRSLVQFDHGLVASETPRLFIDMMAFVEMDHDRQTYLFVQDTREGPVTLKRSPRIESMVEAVTNYVARRLIERERALASAQLPPAAAARPVPPPQPAAGAFGEALGLYLAGAASGIALTYAALKLGWLG